MLVLDGSAEHTCGRCAQVEDLLRLVIKLWEEVSRLMAIRECKREIGAWSHTLPPMTETQQADGAPATVNSLSSLQLTERGDLEDRRQW